MKKLYVIEIDRKKLLKKSIPLLIAAMTTTPVHAAGISESLRPLLLTLQDLAEPVSYAYMIKGFMKIMAGDEHEGYKTIKFAAGGFIGIQWIPYIFKIIKDIKLG